MKIMLSWLWHLEHKSWTLKQWDLELEKTASRSRYKSVSLTLMEVSLASIFMMWRKLRTTKNKSSLIFTTKFLHLSTQSLQKDLFSFFPQIDLKSRWLLISRATSLETPSTIKSTSLRRKLARNPKETSSLVSLQQTKAPILKPTPRNSPLLSLLKYICPRTSSRPMTMSSWTLPPTLMSSLGVPCLKSQERESIYF